MPGKNPSDAADTWYANCPEPKTLHAFSEQTLVGELQEQIAGHLALCPSCEQRLREHDSRDRFIRAIRSPLKASAYAAERGYNLLAEFAKGLADTDHSENRDITEAYPVKAPEPAAPKRLEKYDLQEKLGRGGMGEVYRAMHRVVHQEVAIKFMRAEQARDPQAVARFRREMAALGNLKHLNIIQVTDGDQAEGYDYLVMEYVDGLNLGQLLQSAGPLPVADACELLRQAAEGMQYVHDHGLVHRDLKPSNLLVSRAGVVKVLDWGLSKRRAKIYADDQVTQSGLLMGTADYMAPEQGVDPQSADIRADLYSLGCTLYNLLTAHLPFEGQRYNSPYKKITAHAVEPVPPLSAFRNDIPAELTKIIDTLLAKDPKGRFAEPRDLARRLAPLAVGHRLADLVAKAMDTGLESAAGAATVSRPPSLLSPVSPYQALAPLKDLGRSPRRNISRWAGWAACLLVGAGGVTTAAILALTPKPAEKDPVPVVGEWSPLLTREPELFLTQDPVKMLTTFEFTKGRRQLSVDTGSFTLFKLGTSNNDIFKVRVHIRQSHWSGGMGFYFGLRPATQNGENGWEYQVVRLNYFPRGDALNPGEVFQIQREKHFAYRNPGRTISVNSYEGAAEKVPPPGLLEQSLELEIGGGQYLNGVEWNGVKLGGLTSNDVVELHRYPRCQGDFGLYSAACACAFRDAELLLLQKGDD